MQHTSKRFRRCKNPMKFLVSTTFSGKLFQMRTTLYTQCYVEHYSSSMSCVPTKNGDHGDYDEKEKEQNYRKITLENPLIILSHNCYLLIDSY